jgi:hypothetical protein
VDTIQKTSGEPDTFDEPGERSASSEVYRRSMDKRALLAPHRHETEEIATRLTAARRMLQSLRHEREELVAQLAVRHAARPGHSART